MNLQSLSSSFALRLSLYRPRYTAHPKYTRQNLNSCITMRGVGRIQLCLQEECSGFVPPRYSLAARIKCSCVTVINPIRRYLLGRRSGLLSSAFTARAVATVRRHDELQPHESRPLTVTWAADREHSCLKLQMLKTNKHKTPAIYFYSFLIPVSYEKYNVVLSQEALILARNQIFSPIEGIYMRRNIIF